MLTRMAPLLTRMARMLTRMTRWLAGSHIIHTHGVMPECSGSRPTFKGAVSRHSSSFCLFSNYSPSIAMELCNYLIWLNFVIQLL